VQRALPGATLAALVIAATTALVLNGVAAPATAVDVSVHDEGQLVAALANPSTTTVTLAQDIDVAVARLDISRDVVLELNGHTLRTQNITVMHGMRLTVQGGHLIADGSGDDDTPGITTTDGLLIINSGVVNATGGAVSAGIGGGGGHGGGIITITGGTVTATGGQGGAGIGGGESGAGGTITITGGTVTATGGSRGAGIGGGLGQAGGVITITGGTVTATSSSFGAGIGGGQFGGSGTISIDGGTIFAGSEWGAGIGTGSGIGAGSYHLAIGSDAAVTAAASIPSSSAVGPGAFWDVTASTLDVLGTLTLPAGSNLAVLPLIATSVGSEGKITGEGSIIGGGTIHNLGVITNDSVTATVTANNYVISFNHNYAGAPTADDVRVFASNFADGERTIPVPTRPGFTFTGWNTAVDGSGTTFEASTRLNGDLTVYAQWQPTADLIVMTAPAGAVDAGSPATFTVEAFAGGTSLGDATGDVTFSTDGTDAVIVGNTITFAQAGHRTITATLNSDPGISASHTMMVAAGPLTTTALVLSELNVGVGDTVTATVTGTDAYGNVYADVTAQTVFTSSVPTDIITGNSIRFPTASTHVITATTTIVAATVVTTAAVEVTAAGPSSIPVTGYDAGVTPWVAAHYCCWVGS